MAATAGADVLIGTNRADHISGGRGADDIFGHGAAKTAPSAGAIHAARVGTGFEGAVFAGSAPGDDHLYVVTKDDGRIHRLDPDTGRSTVFLQVPPAELATGGEQGLLGLAFHPGYAANGRFFVHMVNDAGDIEVREYRRSASDPRRADDTEKVIITIPHPDRANHNGGSLAFGPRDGFLYVSTGDGGGANDPHGNAQNLNVLLGKILRLDVDRSPAAGKAYAIPSDNPFVGRPGDDEIWAYGLRNPWRMSFDPATGDLYIGDVGQNAREEVNFRPAASRGGENYGWDLAEGTLGNPPRGAIPPIFEYGRDFGVAVTGGHVYRGDGPALVGSYIFGDFSSGRIWTLRVVDGKAVGVTERTDQVLPTAGAIGQISSFGVDGEGELYVVTLRGDIYRVDLTRLSGDRGDTLRGNAGNDRIYGGPGDDDLRGGAGRDLLRGGFGDDSLKGGSGRDRLKGDAGDDRLAGGKGRDKLVGGTGADVFVFAQDLKRKNVSEIKDFTTGEDVIALDGRIFGDIGDALAGEALAVGRQASDALDRVLYDDGKGRLLYDPDGDGGRDPKVFARIGAGLDLDAGDFLVI